MSIKLVYCLTRKEGLTREQFQDYWLNKHAPLVDSVKHLTGMKRYLQSHTCEIDMGRAARAARGGGEPYDGVMEGWWDSEEQAIAALTAESLAALRALLDDEGRFIDFDKSRIFFTREHVVF
jgi:uncharacterized protein (TIGR02118 family)